jgi:hypothetical protein
MMIMHDGSSCMTVMHMIIIMMMMIIMMHDCDA